MKAASRGGARAGERGRGGCGGAQSGAPLSGAAAPARRPGQNHEGRETRTSREPRTRARRRCARAGADRLVLPEVPDTQSRRAAAAQTDGTHSNGSAKPRAMPRAVGAGALGPARRGVRAPPPLSAARPLPFLLGTLRVGPFRATRGPPPLPAGMRLSAPAAWTSAGGGRGRAGRQGPRLARPDGQSEVGAGAPCRRDTPAAGGARGQLGAGTGVSSSVPGRAFRSRPRACSSGRLAPKVEPWGRTARPRGGLPSPKRRPGQLAPIFRGRDPRGPGHKSVTQDDSAPRQPTLGQTKEPPVPETGGAGGREAEVQGKKQAASPPGTPGPSLPRCARWGQLRPSKMLRNC